MYLKSVRFLDVLCLGVILTAGLMLQWMFPTIEWFQRSGAVCVGIGVVVASHSNRERPKQYWGGNAFGSGDKIDPDEMHRIGIANTSMWAVVGTLVWGFGDLVHQLICFK